MKMYYSHFSSQNAVATVLTSYLNVELQSHGESSCCRWDQGENHGGKESWYQNNNTSGGL